MIFHFIPCIIYTGLIIAWLCMSTSCFGFVFPIARFVFFEIKVLMSLKL